MLKVPKFRDEFRIFRRINLIDKYLRNTGNIILDLT